MKILIAGGGIGGLTAALACQHFGHEAVVLEQAEAISEIGAGIQISPNAMKVFQALGLEEEIGRDAFRPRRIEMRSGRSGAPIMRYRLGDEAVKRWGAEYLNIHRADLMGALLAALKKAAPGSLKLASAVTGYKQTAGGVTAILTDGRQISGDVLIGADGIHSAIREQMLGPEKPHFTGHVAWRTVVPVEKLRNNVPDPVACAWLGRGKHAVTYLLRGGQLANLVAVVERDDWTKESWVEEGDSKEALKDFIGWHPTIRRILKESDQIYRWVLYTRAPLKSWTDGRVALMGDAAHPMLPYMAQGAAMAIEDSWAIAALFDKHIKPEEALKAYKQLRYDRATKVQARSQENGRIFHKRTPLERFGTYGPMFMAGQLKADALAGAQDWLYGYDIVEEVK